MEAGLQFSQKFAEIGKYGIDLSRSGFYNWFQLNGETFRENEKMKRKTLFVASLVVALVAFTASTAQALPSARVTSIKKAFSAIPAPELPEKAASIVSSAAREERTDVALFVIQTVAAKKASALPAVVGAISKASPEVSPAVAAEAVTLSSIQETSIVKAACSGAPEQAAKIAGAVAKVAPKSATAVAKAAMSMVPAASSDVVKTVSEVAPTTKIELPEGTQYALVQFSDLKRFSKVSDLNPAYKGNVFVVNGTIKGIKDSPEDYSVVSKQEFDDIAAGKKAWPKNNHGAQVKYLVVTLLQSNVVTGADFGRLYAKP